MSTYPITGTSAVLGRQSLEVAFVLLVEGYDLAWCSHPDVTAIAAAWVAAGSQWTTFRAGLSLPPEITSSTEIFSSKVAMQGLSFTLTDTGSDLATVFERVASDEATTGSIALLPTASLEPDGTFLVLQPSSTANWGSSGTIYIGQEAIDWTINAGNIILGGLTRGKWSLWGTSSDEDSYARLHSVDMDAGIAPEVSTHPGELVGRNVGLFMCVKKDSATWTAGLPGSADSTTTAEMLWAGRVQSMTSLGDGRYQIDAAHVMEALKQSVFTRQFKAYLAEGKYLVASQQSYFGVSVYRTEVATGIVTLYAAETTTLFSTNDVFSHDEIKALINEQLLAFFNNSPGTEFPSTQRMNLERSSTTGNYAFTLSDTAGAAYTSQVQVFMDHDIWTLLGWNASQLENVTIASTGLPTGRLSFILTAAPVANVAPNPPQRAAVSFKPPLIGNTNYRLRVRDVQTSAEYAPQPTVPSEFHSDTTGFLRIGKFVLAVKASETANEFQILGWFDGRLLAFGAEPPPAPSNSGPGAVGSIDFSEGFTDEGVLVEQVWFEFGTVGSFALRMLTSTGTAGFNHATYDDMPRSMGIALPWTLLDSDSIAGGLNRFKVALYLEKPTPLIQLLESWSGMNGRRFAWRRGRIASVGFGEEASDDVIELTEDNKAMRVEANGQPVIERSVVRYTRDYLVNQVKLRHSHNYATDEWSTETVNDIRSQSKYGIRSHTLDGFGVYVGLGHGLDSAIVTWRRTVEAQALAYFSRPLAMIERTFDVSLLAGLYPGAKVVITDNNITSPVTGTAGVSDLFAWCSSTSFDFRTGVGRATFLFAPHLATGTAHALLPPSARVDTTVNTGSFSSGYDSANKVLALVAHEYSGTSDSTDAASFTAGDKIRVVERVDETDTITTDTIATVDAANNRITLTTGGALTFFSVKVYDVEFDDVDTVTTSQRLNKVYLADANTSTTGHASNDFRVYAGSRTVTVSSTIDYDTRHTFFDEEGDDGESAVEQGQPLSVHLLHEIHDWCNGALSHFTANRVFEWVSSTDDEYVEATDTSSYTLLLGPVWVPLYGGSRSLVVQAYAARGAGASGTIQVITSTGVVRGSDSSFRSTTAAPLTYPDGGINNVSLSVGQGGYDYTSEGTWTPAVVQGEPPGCWLTVTALAAAGGYVRIRGLWVRESNLS